MSTYMACAHNCHDKLQIPLLLVFFEQWLSLQQNSDLWTAGQILHLEM